MENGKKTKKKGSKKPEANNRKIRIALDAMGGDYAPQEIIKGGLLAAQDSELEVVLVGPENVLKKALEKSGYSGTGISIADASEVIGMSESPMLAIKEKRDSSIVVGIGLIKRGEVAAFVSAGNTGAVVVEATLTLGRKKGVSRPALGAVFGFPPGPILCLDLGANAECKPDMLVQFAHMGSVYMEKIFGIAKPRVGLLSNGEEESKGCKTVQKAHKMLKKDKVNFIGNVEGRDLSRGVADVLVTDGFTGNVLLKVGEGIGEMILHSLKDAVNHGSPKVKEASEIIDTLLHSAISPLDYTEYGGAYLFGINGNVIVSHGRSNAKAIRHAIDKAKRVEEYKVLDALKA